MALTRTQVETLLIRRLGTLMTEAGLDGTTDDGTNNDLNDPIGYAIRQRGGVVADITAVADADLAGFGDDETDALLDVAELRTLDNIYTHLMSVDITVAEYSESLSQLPDRVARMIEVKSQRVQAIYGLGRGSLEGGVIDLDFAEHHD